MTKILQHDVDVHVRDDEGELTGEVVHYRAGTTEKDVKHAAQITNESAWTDIDGDPRDVRIADLTSTDAVRESLLDAAAEVGLEPGKDFPADASKEVIAAFIKRRRFTSSNEDAELTGDDPQALATADVRSPGGAVETGGGGGRRRQRAEAGE